MSLKTSVLILRCRMNPVIAKDLFMKITSITNRPFHYHYFHRNFCLPNSTSFLTLKKDNFYDLTCCRRMAGHAKWQNIKHVKEAKDRQKNLLCNKYSYLCRVAVREGGPDPKVNQKLAILFDQAKKNNVPNSVMESALKRDIVKSKFGTIEILGPGGSVIIIEYETDNVGTFRHELKYMCKKYGASIMAGEGRWRAVYEKKGIIKAINQKDGQPLNEEKALDSAIEAGAEEVHLRTDEDEKSFLEFLCAAEDLHPVKKEVEKLYDVEEGYVGYFPMSRLQVDKETSVLVDSFLDELGGVMDIIRIYENVE